MLAGCLCCTLMPAAKDAGWQWYNEKLKKPDPETPPRLRHRRQMDILEKLALCNGHKAFAGSHSLPLI
jgi:conjugal transfer pilus assembly protein TraF